jgi:fructose-specific phosphotransferase system IIA component
MDLIDIFALDSTTLDMKAKNKVEAIHELSLLLFASGRISSLELFEEAVHKREKEVSTGIGFGIGIPHGKSSAVNSLSIAFGRSENGIEFGAIDNQPVKMVFLLAVPEAIVDKEYLHTLSDLARMLVHEDFRQSLFEAKTKKDLGITLRYKIEPKLTS